MYLWWLEYAWPREWHYLEVWSCWRKCVTVGVDFESFLLVASGCQFSPVCLQNKMLNSQLLLHHACLDAAMLPTLMIMD